MSLGHSGNGGMPALVRLRSYAQPAWRAALLAAILAVILGVLGTLVDRVWGQEGERRAGPASVHFAIPRQPLATALQSYARACSVEVLYESEIVTGLMSTPIEGAFTPEMALQVLLGGTELRVRYAHRNAITLALPQTEDDLPPVDVLTGADFALDTLRVSGGTQRSTPLGLTEFSKAVQLEIEKALRQNTKTRSGNYQIGVRLWIDASRKISRVVLAQSTGDIERDASIPGTLLGLTLSRAPPANTPQPVQVVITVRSL